MPRKAKREPTPEPSEPAESSAEEEESSEEEVYVEPNLATRSRRNNAGNGMQALIEDEAAAEVEEMFKEEENDEEFDQKEEKDEFDSDFGSTDEGEGDEEDDEEAGERRLQREAKEAKKAAASKKKRGFQAPVHPFARQTKAQRAKAAKASTDGGAEASTSATTLDGDGEEAKPAAKRRKKSMSAVDPAFLVPQRESSRRTAVESKKQVQDRLKEMEQKKSTAPKATKKATVTLTQADLIAEALETEEVNRAALLAFYAAEEDRREMERIAGMRYEIIGAKLTFLSRAENRPVDDGKGKGKGKGKEKMEAGRKRLIEVIGESGQKGWKAGAAQSGGAAAPNGGTDSATAVSVDPTPSTSTSSSSKPKPTRSSLRNILNSPSVTPAGSPPPVDTPPTPPERPEYTRNWLIFGNTDEEPITRGQELEAIFGEHEDWTREAPVPAKTADGIEGRGYLCPITGLPAKYRDPRTLTPYATLAAYRILTSLTDAQNAVYSDSLGAYTGLTGMPGGVMKEVEANWARRPGARAAAAAVAAAAGAGTGMGASGSGAGTPRYAAASPSIIAAPSRPMVGTPTQILPSPSLASVSGPGTKKPRAPRQSVSSENPYKVEYAHAGGSGRGNRGRGSLDGAAQAMEGQQAQGAYQHIAPQPGTPYYPQQQYQHLQQQQAQNPYALSGVYSPSPLGGGGSPSPFPQHQQQQQHPYPQHYPHPHPHPHPHASPSLVGTSSAPQARSISFGSRPNAAGGGAGDPFGGGLPSPYSHHPQPQQGAFNASYLPSFPGGGQGGQGGGGGTVVLPSLPGAGGLPGLPPLPGTGGGGGGGGA